MADGDLGRQLSFQQEINQAIRARKKAQKQKEQDVDQLKEDVSELKGMMKLILEKLDG